MSPTSRRPKHLLALALALACTLAACEGRPRALRRPGQLGFDAAGDLYVADFPNHRVVRFGPDLAYRGELGERGIGDDQLWSPQSLAVTPEGEVIIVDHSLATLDDPTSDTRRVKRFGRDGALVARFDPSLPGDRELSWPGSSTLTPEGIVIGDYDVDRVELYTLTGEHVRTIAPKPPSPPYVGPGFVRWAGGRLWVAEYETHRVRAFTLAGDELMSLGKEGTGPGEMLFPDSVDVAPDGTIVVSDIGNFRFHLFAPDGTWQEAIAPEPARPGIKFQVVDVRFDKNGRLFVSDGKGARVLVYGKDRKLERTLQAW